MSKGNEPAYPMPEDNFLSNGTYNNSGLTKRELIAAMTMQGLLSNGDYPSGIKSLSEMQKFVSGISVGYADALLEALNGKS